MVAIPKLIGLISCGFLLYLGLSNAASAEEKKKAPPKVEADVDHTRQPGGPRVGGQSGTGGEPATGSVGEADVDHTRQPGGPRVGGQGGQ